MTYAFRFLSKTQQAEIKAAATKKPTEPAVDDSLLTAWEADLAAHQALHAAASDKDTKAAHAEAIKALEAALTKAR